MNVYYCGLLNFGVLNDLFLKYGVLEIKLERKRIELINSGIKEYSFDTQ
ncbi:hypothetical protein SKB0068_11870 [Staphylococcus hominis subsp. novobiosepticus]